MNLQNNSTTLTEEIFKAYIEVVKSFLESVSPSLVVNSLQALFQNFNDTDLLLNSSNVEVGKCVILIYLQDSNLYYALHITSYFLVSIIASDSITVYCT